MLQNATRSLFMSDTATVHARINPTVKKEAESVFLRLGMTPTEAVRLFYTQVSLHKAIPFQLHIPNELTKKTLNESAKGINVNHYNNVEDLFASWDE